MHGGASSSGSAKLVIGNRRWGAHGYVNSGRMYARPSGSGSSSSGAGAGAGKGKGKGKGKAAVFGGGAKRCDDYADCDDYGRFGADDECFEDDDHDGGYKPRYDSTLQGKQNKKGGGMGRRAKRALKNKGAAKNGLDRAVC